MDIGKGAANNAKYLTQPKIGSPDISGDLTNASIPFSGARSLTLEDIEHITGIDTYEERCNATEYYAQQKGEQYWYTNTFSPNFMNEAKPYPTTNIKMPTLIEGIVDNKPLYTSYIIYNTDSNIPNELQTHIFGPDRYWLASRCVASASTYSYFSARFVFSGLVGGYLMGYGFSDSFDKRNGNGSVRPVVVLKSKVQLMEYTQDGYNWKVNQN